MFTLLSNPGLTPSPLIAAVIQRVIESAHNSRIILPRNLWLQFWKRWGETEVLGEGFSTWLEKRINEQGVGLSYTRFPSSKTTHTPGAVYSQSPVQPKIDPRLASITAAAQSSTVSANLLLGMAHVLVDGFYPDSPHSRDPPNAGFLTTLIRGLVERKAYGRALAVWEDAERRIALSSSRSKGRSNTRRGRSERNILSRSSSSPPFAQSASSASTTPLTFTPALLEIGLSAYAKSGNPLRALQILEKYVRVPRQRLRSRDPTSSPKLSRRVDVAPSVLNDILDKLPPRAQHLVFTYASRRWDIQPDTTAFEIVMRGAARLVRGKPSSTAANLSGAIEGEASFGANVRELRDGIRRLFQRTKAHETLGVREYRTNSQGYQALLDEALDSTSASTPREVALIRLGAIEIFRSVVLGNWPFIAGTDEGYQLAQKSEGGPGILTPTATAMFVPTPLREPDLSYISSLLNKLNTYSASPVDQDRSNPTTPFQPTPLHPSPTPRFPNAHPTPRTWTAYIALLAPDDIPEAFQWMRAADEFLRFTGNTDTQVLRRNQSEFDGLAIFRPERVALLDALMRWEGAVLAQETPVGRAWSERLRRVSAGSKPPPEVQDDRARRVGGVDTLGDNDGIGREGELRAWLVHWLGPEGVPSRDEVARAMMETSRI
ncbi:hypothetical protein BDV93DRAFT_528510 [Ceratobasidium sp. AG-I]|nr:hypothetical protein BDV93DRAFT_528510 [Ceratobasidium sp. AG-I]